VGSAGVDLEEDRRSAQAVRDAELRVAIERVWKENYGVYGARKVWHRLGREGIEVSRSQIE